MDQKASLFSRARPGTYLPKKKRGFLCLPGEIRNKIYSLYFLENFRCEILGKNTKLDRIRERMRRLNQSSIRQDQNGSLKRELSPLPPRKNTTLRISRRLGNSKHAHVNALRTKWSTSLCPLILVCKQVHLETLVFLYQCTTFVFSSPIRINNFLQSLTSTNLALVTSLELHYKRLTSCDSDGVQRLDLPAWTEACKAVAKQLVNLRELHVWVDVGSFSPLYMDLHQEWVTLFRPFRRLLSPARTDTIDAKVGTSKGLELVNVYFSSYYSSPNAFIDKALGRASVHLHQLYGEAIARAILGADEEEAMAEFKKAWEGRYARWQHHLRFSTTGW